MYKPLPIGIEDFKELVENYYYIDKTLFIKELLDNRGKVSLFTRPRRFGKTLELSMLRYFFEKNLCQTAKATDNRHLFSGLKIMKAGDSYLEYMGQYPVISLSLKSAKQPDFEMAYGAIVNEISKEFDRHSYVILGDTLSLDEKEQYIRIRGKRLHRLNMLRLWSSLQDV